MPDTSAKWVPSRATPVDLVTSITVEDAEPDITALLDHRLRFFALLATLAQLLL